MSKENPAIAALLTNLPSARRRRLSAKNSARSNNRPAESAELDRLNQIYFFAARLFYKKGYDATSMSDIAEATGITKAGSTTYTRRNKICSVLIRLRHGHGTIVHEPARPFSDGKKRLRAIITITQTHQRGGSTDEGHRCPYRR